MNDLLSSAIPCLALLLGVWAAQAADTVIPGNPIRATLSAPNLEYALRSVAIAADGASAELVVAAHPIDQRPIIDALQWVSLNNAGRFTVRGNPLAPKTGGVSADEGRRLLSMNGSTYLLTTSSAGGMQLVRLAPAGPAPGKAVSWPATSPNVRQVTLAKESVARLAGDNNGRPSMVEIDAEGKLLAELNFSAEQMSVIATVSEPDGSVTVACERGVVPNATAWLGKVSRDGKVSGQKTFPGRPLDLVRNDDGGYLLLIETSSNGAFDVAANGLQSDLSSGWSRSLATKQRVGPAFRAAPIPGGGYIVAGIKDRGLSISRLASDGNEVWTETHEPAKSADMEMTTSVELASARGKFLVAYSAFVVEGRQQHQVVRTIQFGAQ